MGWLNDKEYAKKTTKMRMGEKARVKYETRENKGTKKR